MNNFTTETYEIKRKILNFIKKLTFQTNKVQKKFMQDMIYGIAKSKSILLSEIADSLMEDTKKINTIERLGKNLIKDIEPSVKNAYRKEVRKVIGKNPVIMVDDSDVTKPYGYQFESLGMVRDGSSSKKEYEKGYIVTEMVAVTKDRKQPISLFSHIHSSKHKNYKSTNTITYQGLDEIIEMFEPNERGTFVFDRGYDMNELFKYMYKKNQDFIIRLTEKRKLFHKGKWYKSTVLRDTRKGKIKTIIQFDGEKRKCYISHLNVKITASKKQVNLILVYGLGEKPMMLVTNKKLKGKKDVEGILRTYLSRWRIEEHFRFKKQEYGFENFRVRTLKAMNNLNQVLTYTLGFIELLAEKQQSSRLAMMMIKNSNSLRDNIQFYGYQISKGIANTLKYAKTGIKQWQHIRYQTKYQQLCFNFAC